jgi:nucleoid-associated protein YgaU
MSSMTFERGTAGATEGACGPRGTLRLTRRGRAVVVLVALFAALVLLAMRGAPAASTDVVHHPRLYTVVVAPGDTLWSIARRTSPDSDPRVLVAEIERLNNLGDAGTILVGQPLSVPAR